jgi:hypothetical protein
VSPASVDHSSSGDDPPTTTILVGRFALEVGAPEGTVLREAEEPAAEDAQLGPALAEAEEEVGREDRTLGAAVTDVIDEAEAVTAEVERAATLFETLAKGGTLDPAVLREEIDSLLDWLAELDRSGRLAEALRLARALERLLELVKRWRDLGQTLATAARAARGLGDQHGMAWVRHELGTVQLVAGDHASAEHNLEAARELRRELGDEVGLAATERNMLSLCRDQQRLLRGEQSNGGISWRRLVTGAIALLIAGGAVGALINPADGGQRGTDPSATACFDGEDNDGDELIDSDDPGCASSEDDDEADPPADA